MPIVVVINFADSDVPNSVRIIVSSIIIIILAAGVYYLVAPISTVTSLSIENETDSLLNTDTSVIQKKKPVKKKNKQANNTRRKKNEPPTIKRDEPANAGEQTKTTSTQDDLEATAKTIKEYDKYKVKSKAYFHNKPDESTRRNAFINNWNNAELTALNEQNGFIYVTFTNQLGQTSKGWLLKSDLERVEE